jgi:hypothetical protein
LDKEGVAGLEREVRRMFPEGQDPSPVEDPESSSGHVTLLLDPFRDPPPIREPNPPDPLEELWADFERLIQPGARK